MAGSVSVLERPKMKMPSAVSAAESGSYGHAAAAYHGVVPDTAPAAEKLPWLRELGMLTTDVVTEKRIWSPRFETHWQSATWSETYKGRLAIRSVSRLFAGAAFYVAAQYFAGDKLAGYTNEKGKNPENILQCVAKFIDSTAGNAIQAGVHLVTGDADKAEAAVIFRNTKNFGYKDANGQDRKGRSVGHEAVAVTFDFAAMSFGDFMTRYFIGLFDPKAKTGWINEEGKLDIPNGLKELGKKIFRGLTYAAGEDIAVALPYIYYTRGQQYLINKLSKGFQEDADRGLFGGSFKVNEKGEIVGDYQMEGVMDIVGRFTGYNVLTKMFRDFYNGVEGFLEKWKGDNHSLATLSPDKMPKTLEETASTIVDKIKEAVKYVAVTTAKTVFYMVPSALVFAIPTVARVRTRGLAINPDGVDGKPDKLGIGSGESYSHIEPGMKEKRVRFRDSGVEVQNPFYNPDKGIDHHRYALTNDIYTAGGHTAPWYNGIMNMVGNATYWLGNEVDKIGEKIPALQGIYKDKTKKRPGEVWARAGGPYAAYFMLKTDVASAFLDTNRSNVAIERFGGGLVDMVPALVTFNGQKIGRAWHEIAKGAEEISLAITKQPFHDPAREQLVQEQMRKAWRLSNEAYQDYEWTGYKAERNQQAYSNTQDGENAGNRPTFVQLHALKPAVKRNYSEKELADGKELASKFSDTIEKKARPMNNIVDLTRRTQKNEAEQLVRV